MARYRHAPNYIARKSTWLAWDWWNILIYMTIIPAAFIILHFLMPDKCNWLIMLGVWCVVPITAWIAYKKIKWWNVVFLMLLFPAVFVVLHFVAPEACSNWLIGLAIWCAVPVSIIVVKYIIIRHKYVEFYDTCVVEKWGVFFKHSKKTVFPEVTAVKTYKNILGYGNVFIDVVGPWDVNLRDMARPEDVREYLVLHMLNSAAVENISNNPYIAAIDGIF